MNDVQKFAGATTSKLGAPTLGENARLGFPDLPDVRLSVREFEVEEGISRLFTIRLVCVSPAEDLDLAALVGARAGFELSWRPDRVLRGLCASAELVRVSDDKEGLATYEVVLVPTLWRLSQRVQNRLFQHVTIPEIVRTILGEWKIEHTWRIQEHAYPPLELRTQYGETDLAFVSRLLEEAGISYWFVDEGAEASRLVLGDAPHSGERRAGGPIPFVDDVSLAAPARSDHLTHVRLKEQSRPGRFSTRDYDFLRPRHALFAQADATRAVEHAHEQFHFAPGFGLAENPLLSGRTSQTPVADDLGVARRREEYAQERQKRMLEAASGERRVATYEASVSDLSPGAVFCMGRHPHPELAEDKALLAVRHRMTGTVADTSSWRFEGAAVHASVPFRPPQITPKPRIHGLQTAVVVGPEPSNLAAQVSLPRAVGAVERLAVEGAASADVLVDNTIYVDEHGRVRVQFPWDREHGFDQRSSAWTRVSQGWAGAGYGLFTIPRVGHEVLIAFLDGDPDQPLVVGRVHNAAEPTPYPLPAAKTVSTWKTASSPGGEGANELRFDDAAGAEHVYLQAQKDMDHLVKNDLKQAVGKDATRFVQAHDTHAVGGSRTDFVNLNEARAVGVNKAEFVGMNRTSHVGVDDQTVVGTRWSVTVARGLTNRLVHDLEAIAGNVGDVVRSAATTVLGGIPATPLSVAAESALASLGSALYEGLKSLVEPPNLGFETEPGPPPTTIEVVDRQIKFSTGEASIILDGPNVTISAQGNIVLHAMDHVSVLSEKEVAIGGRSKVAVVSATDDVIVQSSKDLHLNPFASGGGLPKAQRLDPAAPMAIGPEVCAVCGGELVGEDMFRRSCAAMLGALPAGRASSLPTSAGAGGGDGEAFASEARSLQVDLQRHGFKGDIMEHAVDVITRGLDGRSPAYEDVLAWLAEQRHIDRQTHERLRAITPADAAAFSGIYLGWWSQGAEAPAMAVWSWGGAALTPEPIGKCQIDLVIGLPTGARVTFCDRRVLQVFIELMLTGTVRHV
ncbi:type VI secretion system Vgr family protein [Polyangium spumosum]|nr:type VI secretion system tip protein TssI/VgrG [Polyangium spumosum]